MPAWFFESLGFKTPENRTKGRSAVSIAVETALFCIENNENYEEVLSPYPKIVEFIESDNECFYCGKDLPNLDYKPTAKTYTCDHVWPLSKGGEDTFYNVVKCCSKCNSDKSNHNPIDFGITMYLLRKYRPTAKKKFMNKMRELSNVST